MKENYRYTHNRRKKGIIVFFFVGNILIYAKKRDICTSRSYLKNINLSNLFVLLEKKGTESTPDGCS